MAGALISIGAVGVDVVPNMSNIYARMASQVLPAAARVGDEAGDSIGQRMQRGIARGIRDGMQRGGTAARGQAARQGEQAGGTFGRAMRTRLEAALRSLPDITVGANTSEADSDIQALRVRLETLRDQRIGIDIDAEAARIEAREIAEQLRLLGASHPNVQVRVDTAQARAGLAEFQAEIERLSRTSVSPRIEVEGGFAQRLRAAVEAAQAQLPDITVGANTSAAVAEIQSLRGQLEQLRTQRVGIDVDAASATARINDIRARLDRLAASSATVDVRVDAASASAQLAAVNAQVTALDARNVNIGTGPATGGILALVAALGLIVVPPAIGVMVAGFGALAAVTTAAAAGVGAFALAAVPGIMKVANALQLQKSATEAAATAAVKSGADGARQAIAAQQQAAQMAGAQQAVASAQRNAAQSVADAQDRVRSAVQGVADAQEQAAARTAQAVQKVSTAERSLAQAQKDSRRAQEELTDARKAAREELEDLNARLAGSALDERSAVLSVSAALRDLEKIKKDPKADQLARDQAQLTYDEAVQHLTDQRRENARLKTEVAAANRAGVEGSKTVVQAQDRLTQAQQKTADASKDLKEAQLDVAKTQAEGAKQVARAQQQVADAQKAVARAQVQGAEQIASAQRQVQSAQLAAAAASQQAAGGMDEAATAAAKYQAALAKMNPATRGTFEAVQRLRDGFKAWGDSLAPVTMPLLTRMLDGLTRSLPGLTPLVEGAARAIGGLMDRASVSLKSPFWVQWKADLVDVVPRAVTAMGVSFGNVFKGMAGAIGAFFPHMDGIADRMESITGRFAEWGANLKGSPEFERFLANAARDAPMLGEALSSVARAFAELSNSLAPLRGPVFDTIAGIARGIAAIASAAPLAVQWLVLFAIALKSINVILAVTAALAATTPFGWIVYAIAAVVAAIALLILHWDSIWPKIVSGARWVGDQFLWLWREAVKPAFDGIASGALWLWNTVLKPTFDVIGMAAKILAAVVLTILVAPVVIAFGLLAAAGLALWRYGLQPTFEGIGAMALWLWREAIKPVTDFIWDSFQWVGEKASWLWSHSISPAFGSIGDSARWLWTNSIKPVLDFIWSGFQWVGDKAGWLWGNSMSPSFGLITAGFKTLGSWAVWLYDHAIKPAFDWIADKVAAVCSAIPRSFEGAKAAVGQIWTGLQEVTAAPVRFVVDAVYNNGIRKVWNFIASKVGLPQLDAVAFADGGVLPGYTPGRDPHHFYSPTGGRLDMSGGEAVMRPEWTSAVGPGYVHAANAAARRGGTSGVRAFLNQGQQAFSIGGIIGDTVTNIKNTVKKIPGVEAGMEFVKDVSRGMAAQAAEKGLQPIRGLINQLPDGDGWTQAIKGIPLHLMDKVIEWLKGEDAKYAGGANVQAAMAWAKTQAGKPYQWGGGGNPSWDCSGFMAAIQQVILGKAPGRLWTTFDFNGSQAPAGWKQNADAPFRVGVTNQGVGHMSGTVGGVNVESRGGDGVVVGPAARAWNDRLYQATYGFEPSRAAGGGPAPSGQLLEWINVALAATGTPPPGSLAAWQSGMATLVGRESGGNPWAANTTDSNARAGIGSRGLAQVIPPTFEAYRVQSLSNNIFDPVANLAASINYIKSRYGSIDRVQQANPNMPPKGYALGGIIPRLYDSGGALPPGLTLAMNNTGRSEQVLTGPQWASVQKNNNRGGDLHVKVFVGTREITDIVRTEVSAAEDSWGLHQIAGRR